MGVLAGSAERIAGWLRAIGIEVSEAARYIPLEARALSPQCGFSSSEHGNDLSVAEQIAKLRLVVEIAAEVWG